MVGIGAVLLEKNAGSSFYWQRMMCHQTSLFLFRNILAVINHFMDTSTILKKDIAKAAIEELRMHDV